MKIGIFGGTFDPFTLAHREIIKEVLRRNLVDKVIVAPTIVDWHRHDKTAWLTDSQRLLVIEKILSVDKLKDSVIIYDHDIKVKALCAGKNGLENRFVESHRFIDTLINIKLTMATEHDTLHVIMGNDSWNNFESWSNWQNIAEIADQILVADGRIGSPRFHVNKDVSNVNWFTIKSRFSDCSATKIRAAYTDVNDYINDAINSIAEEEKTTENLLLHTPIFDVVQGKEIDGLKPIKINAPDWVTIIAEYRGQYLVEKQFRYGSNSVVEEFPCGMVEQGEDPLDAAMRELEEETGYKIDKSNFLKIGATNPNPAFMTNTMHYFYAKVEDGKYETIDRKLDEHEKIEYGWVEKNVFKQQVFARAKDFDKTNQVPAILLSAIQLLSIW